MKEFRARGWTTLAGLLALAFANLAIAAPPQGVNGPSVDSIRKHAAQLAKYRDLLNDKDPTIRLSAFNEMENSSDPALQELAYEVAFASSEMSMRSLALRARLTHWSSFSFDVEGVSGNEQYTKMMPANVTYHAGGADQARGILFIADRPIQNPADAAGEVAASGLEVIVSIRRSPVCSGRMRLDDTGSLSGTLTCTPPGAGVGAASTLAVKARTRLY